MQSPGNFQGKEGIPYRTLGKTGEKVSMVGLGGFHIVKKNSEDESIKIVRTAIETASISWTTVGIITTVSVKSAWVKRCGTDIVKKLS